MAAKASDKAAPHGGAEPPPPVVVTGPLGLSLADLSPETRSQFGIAGDVAAGVVVTAVEDGSAAEEKRLQPGDVIVEVGQERGGDAGGGRRAARGARRRTAAPTSSWSCRTRTATSAGSTCRCSRVSQRLAGRSGRGRGGASLCPGGSLGWMKSSRRIVGHADLLHDAPRRPVPFGRERNQRVEAERAEGVVDHRARPPRWRSPVPMIAGRAASRFRSPA